MYLLDGSNLAGALFGDPRERKALLSAILRWARKRKNKITLFFDGPTDEAIPKGRMSFGNVLVLLSPEMPADAMILRLAREKGKSCIVVTDDGELIQKVKPFVQRILSTQQFKHKIGL